MRRILVVEDDEQLARLLELEILHNGYAVDVVENGNDVVGKLHIKEYDLVLLDLMLPGIDGMEVCKRIRSFSQVPIIMLTANDEISQKITGLDSGADDYVTKPFVTDELFARIRAAMRRREEKKGEDEKVLQADNLTLNRSTREVIRAGRRIDLSKREFDLLEYMLLNKNIVLSREVIISQVWGYEFMGDTNAVDVYIRYLRSKIDDTFEKKIIHTYRGIGYSIKETDGNETPS